MEDEPLGTNMPRRTEETTVERLTLVSHLGRLHLDPPVYLQAGETFWVEDGSLHVRGVDGAVRQVRGSCSGRIPGKRYLAPGLDQQDDGRG